MRQWFSVCDTVTNAIILMLLNGVIKPSYSPYRKQIIYIYISLMNVKL